MEEWAFATLKIAVRENVTSKISGKTTANRIWDKLKKLYMNKSHINHLILLRMFFTCKMKEGTSLKVHLNTFDGLVMKMKAVDLKIKK